MSEPLHDSKVGDIFYRYEANMSSDGWPTELRLDHYRVTKVTPCGVRLYYVPYPDRDLLDWQKHNAKIRFVLLESNSWGGKSFPTRKRFAHPDKKAALRSFVARKIQHIGWLKFYLKNAEDALVLAEKELGIEHHADQDFIE